MLRFVDLQTRVKQFLDEAATSATTDTTGALVKAVLNASHQRICTKRVWAFMKWPRTETLTITAGQKTITLNPNVGKLLYVWDASARAFLTMYPLRQWEQSGMDLSATSDKNAAIYGNYSPISAQPDEEFVSLVSDDAADTAVTVTLRGIDANGEIVTEVLTANGTTPVDGVTEFVALLNITKSDDWAGTLTLSTVTRGTILRLGVDEYAKQYPTLELIEAPASTRTMTYAFTRVPQLLVEDNDIPETPYPYSLIHVYDALMEIATYRTDLDGTDVAQWGALRDGIMKELEEQQDVAIAGSSPRLVRDVESGYGRPAVFL